MQFILSRLFVIAIEYLEKKSLFNIKNLVMKKLLFVFFVVLIFNSTNAQAPWYLGGNTFATVNGTNNILGTFPFLPVRVMTGGTVKGYFTVGNSLNDGVGGLVGDGLSLRNPSCVGCAGSLDMAAASGGNASFIKWSGVSGGPGSGLIKADNLRFEEWAHVNGFWFNADGGGIGAGAARYIFNMYSSEVGRIGTNNLWRIGLNPAGANAVRRLEVFDATGFQFRISRQTGFVDFDATGLGHLNILPAGGGQNVGINVNIPTEKIDVDGNARFRNIPAAGGSSIILGISQGGSTDLVLSQLAFNNNPNNVLSGNGIWVPLPTPTTYFSQNGVVSTTNGNVFELGAPCSGATASQNNMATLTSSRRIIIGGENILFDTPGAQDGRISIGNIGAANCVPGNKLEIVADPACPTPSGLRLTGLPSGSVPIANPGIGVLAVNANGDVIYVNDAGGAGNLCTATPNPLAGNWQVPLNNNNFYFTGLGAPGTNDVKIGLPCGFGGSAKLMVYQSTAFPSGPAVTTPSTTYAGSFWNAHVNPTFTNNNVFYGLSGAATPPLNPNNSPVNAYMRIGVYGNASHASYSYGMRADAHSHSGGYQVGGVFTVNANAATTAGFSAGIYATAPNLPNSYAAYFNGTMTSGNIVLPSDSLLKRDIDSIPGAISKLMNLHPIGFNFDTALANMVGLNLPAERTFGFEAQDVRNVFPSLVYNLKKPADIDTAGNQITPEYNYQGINYIGFIGLHTKAIQEQQLSIDSLRNTPPGSVQAGNGLTLNSGVVELGGTLTQNTFLFLNGKELTFASGNIGFGGANTITGSSIFHRGQYNTMSGNTSFVVGNGNGDAGSGNKMIGDGNQSADNGSANNIFVGNGNSLNGAAQNVLLLGGGNVAENISTNSNTALGSSNTITGFRSHAIGNSVAATSNSVWIGSSTNGGADQNVVAANFNMNTLADQRDFPAINIFENGVGIKTFANPGTSLAVKGIAIGFNATTALSVEAGPNAGSYAANFSGDVQINGNLYGTQFGYSDNKFKTNKTPITNAGALLAQLKPINYYYDTVGYGSMNFNSALQHGFSAQDVEAILPELVLNKTTAPVYDTAGNVIVPAVSFKALNSNGLIALLAAALKEEKSRNDQQDSVITQLSSLVNSCCANQNTRTNKNTAQIDVELSDKGIVVLGQNEPNPFEENTVIPYTIPENAGFAQIHFYDMNGRTIKVVDIKTKGKGQLNVFANDLSSGMYSYSLIIDGKLVDTKKMMKTQ
jgi:hypothetical protein